MTSLSIQEAQAQLPDLVHGLTFGDEVLILENDQPVARIDPRRGTIAAGTTTPGLLAGHGPLYGPGLRRPAGRLQGVYGMRLLLDAHALIWYADQDHLLSSSPVPPLPTRPTFFS